MSTNHSPFEVLKNFKNKPIQKVNEWELIENRRKNNLNSDQIHIRLAATKNSHSMLLTLRIGNSISELLKLTDSTRIIVMRNKLNPTLMKFQKSTTQEGYKLYKSVQKTTTLSMKITINMMRNAILDKSMEAAFDITEDGFIIDLSSLIQ